MAKPNQGQGPSESQKLVVGSEDEHAEGLPPAEGGDATPLSSWAALAELEDEGAAGPEGLLGLDDALLARLASPSTPPNDPFEGSVAAPNSEAWLDEPDSLLSAMDESNGEGTDAALQRDDISEMIDLHDLLDEDAEEAEAITDVAVLATAEPPHRAVPPPLPVGVMAVEPELVLMEPELAQVPSAEPVAMEAPPVEPEPVGAPRVDDGPSAPTPSFVVLGEIPEYAPITAEWLPEGAPPQPDWSWGEGAGVSADLPMPNGAGPQAGRFQRVLRRLRHEIRGEADPTRLAALFHAYAVIAHRWLGDADVAAEAARAAWVNDPAFVPARDLLDTLLAAKGDRKARLELFERGDAAALTHAGHLAVKTSAKRALDDWGWAAEYDAGALEPMLAAVLVLYGDATLGTPIPTLEWALQRITTSGFWDVLGLEHVRLTVANDETQAGAAWLQALDQLGDTPALAAAVEASALRRSDWVLLETQAHKRLAANEAISDVARQALGFTRAWSLERQGRLEAASEGFDGLLEHAGHWAALVTEVARAAGDDVTEGRALTAEADARPPGPWRAASLVARAQLAQRGGDEIVARAAWRAALAEDPTCVPAIAALDQRARASDDLISVQDRAADEIEALELQLDEADAPTAERLIARLVTRYYRLARLLETRLNAPALALDYHKRALGLAPDFMPALLELERIFSAQQDWSALVALYLGRAMRGEQAAADQRPWLLAAADVLRVHLADDSRAAKLYLRALKIAPNDPTALRGAADALVMMGEPARAALVVGRLAARASKAEAAALEIRAAWLHEQAGDAPGALAAYQRALRAVPNDGGALDSVLRLAQQSGDMAPVHALAASPEVLSALLALQVAEALMAADEVVAAADFAHRWRGVWTGDMPASVDVSMRVLEARAADARGDWAAVVEALQGRAVHAEVGTRTTLLARAGELQEFRLGDLAGALLSYEAVLDLHASHVAARAGFERLGPMPEHGHAGGPWWARAAAAHDLPARAVILQAQADLTDDPREAAALRAVAGAEVPAAVAVSSRAAAVTQYIEAVRAGDSASISGAADHLAGPLAAIARWRGAEGAPEVAQEAVATLADELAAPLWSAGAHAAVAPGDADEVQHLEAVLRLTPDDDARGQQLAEALMAIEDWPRLRTLYEQQLEAAPSVARLPIARALASLQADRFDEPGLAFETLSAAAAEGGADVRCDLRIADYAERAGRSDDADAWFARATAHSEADDRTFVSHARALEARDDIPGAIERLEAGVAAHGETKDLLERLAELRSRQRDWRGVVRALLRLVELEPEACMRARRAMAIARILSRITGDHRRAAGWYKRAVELDPSQLGAVWHMMAEAELLPPDQVPRAHIDDAIRRARGAQLAALAEHPTQVSTLRALQRLALAAQDAEAERCVTEVLHLVGVAEPDAQLTEAADTTIPVFARAMSAQAHGAVEAEGIEDLAGSVFSALADPLLDRLMQRPDGALAPDTPMTALAQSLALALGVESFEVREGSTDGYTPRPAVLLESTQIETSPTLGDVYTLAARVEALRDGRGLLKTYPAPVLSALMVGLTQKFELRNTLSTASDVPAVDAGVLAGVELSPDLGPHLDALLGQGGYMDVSRFAEAVAETARRVGLVCCGSLAVALEAQCGHCPAPDALSALLDADPAARALFLFAVDPACAGARRSLGLAGT